MYKARIEAVNGSRVRAGGKWLRCIGNKSFSVGDYVFTDGLCAFGHFQEAQQPPVISPYKEAIPIITFNNGIPYFYSFDNSGLHNLSPTDFSSDIVAYSLFTNDKKRNVAVSSDPDIYAFNLDDNGNFFKIRACRNSERYVESVEIVKNDIVINKIDTSFLEDDTLNEALGRCFPVETFRVNYQEHYTSSYIAWAFIDNENNWAFLLMCLATEATYYDGRPFFPYSIENWTTAVFSKFFFVSPKGIDVFCSFLHCELPHFEGDLSRERDDIFISSVDSTLKFPLQDGYYYQITKLTTQNEDADFSVFSPKGNFIFSGTSSFVFYFNLVKTKKGFLFSVNSLANWGTDNPSNSYFGSGVYLLRNGLWNKIIDYPCIQLQLKPMKYIKNWVNRIQFFS